MKIGIIGAGPSGLSTAIRLSQLGHQVIILEASKKHDKRIGEHLAAEAWHEFKRLSIPTTILQDHSIPCLEVHNGWGQKSIHYNESIYNPYGNGYILSRPDFDHALRNYCQSIGVQILTSCRVQKVNYQQKCWSITTEKGNFVVDFLVDASGRNSKFKLEKGVSKLYDDQLIGITRWSADTSKLLDNSHLLVEPTHLGWWYTTQIASGETIATFMTDANILTKSKFSSQDFWEEALQSSTHTRLRMKGTNFESTATVKSAHSQIRNKISGIGWLTVGDAAASYDPLSSAGILKGFRMGHFAANQIDQWSTGNKKALADYNQQVQAEYQDYLQQKQSYYQLENRWLAHPFWYKRNLRPDNIMHFTVCPQDQLELLSPPDPMALDFLARHFPEIQLNTFLNALNVASSPGQLISYYLQSTQSAKVHKDLFQLLECLKMMKIIKISSLTPSLNTLSPVFAQTE